MAPSKNRYGLSRRIPEPIKKSIRQNSKFGCVICRNAIYQYEHIQPIFADAESHDSNNMCLLCGSCHDRVTRGQYSKDKVKAAYKKVRENDNVKPPLSDFDLSSNAQEIAIGNCLFVAPQTIFEIDGEDILSLKPPEEPGAPPLLSGAFYDLSGEKVMEIVDNEWTLPSNFYDVSVVGRTLTIMKSESEMVLKIKMHPPNKLEIQHIKMMKGRVLIETINGMIGVFLLREFGRGPGLAVDFHCYHPNACVVVDSSKAGNPITGLRMVGGEGVYLDGPDICLGRGNGKMYMGKVEVFL